jgi:predicted flap endonuclease-1-like 5' DNA nuclease
MVALFVQTLLLMAAAYFIGAALACIVRRSLHRPAEPVPAGERRVDPLPEVLQAGAARLGQGAEGPITVPSAMPAPAPITQPSAAPAAITMVAQDAAPPQDLKRIRHIDTGIEAGLNRLGVRRYEQIAAWMQPDIARFAQVLSLQGRISQENWIEQAQVLAKGGETHYSARLARGEAAKAEPTPDEGEPRRIVAASPVAAIAHRASTGGAAGVVADVAVAAITAVAPVAKVSTPDVSERAAFAAGRTAEPAAQAKASLEAVTAPSLAPAVAIRPAAPATHDNLQRISGIDSEIETSLAGQGVTRYSQIAHWSPADVARFEAQLATGGRIGRENWIEQAQILSRGGDTAFSRAYDRRARDGTGSPPRPAKLADAIRDNAGSEATRRSDIGALRSVRSQAYQNADPGPEAAQRAGYQMRVPRAAQPDDLKRIRGIGVLIEKKLNSMGIVGYEQIADWTAEEIGRVSQSLDFKGRIERENWVEQARILASGGATEFSRRVDRGEVETSRYRP